MKTHKYINYMHKEGVTPDATNDKITISFRIFVNFAIYFAKYNDIFTI